MEIVSLLLILVLIFWIIYKFTHSESDNFDDFINQKTYNKNLSNKESKIKSVKSCKNRFYEFPKSKQVNNSLDKAKIAYNLLLERPEWKKYRLKVLTIKGEKCEWCGSNKILQVHHKYYLKYPDGRHILPWKYNINALLVLCKDCHEKAHKKYKIKTYYTNY